MACNPAAQKHSTTVAGAGLCCSKVGQPGFLAPPPGTLLPPYTKGAILSFEHINAPAGNRCGTCVIAGSKNPMHPGRPILKWIPGGPGCPTSSRCCALATA